MMCLIALQKKIRSKLRFFFLNFVIIFQTPTWNALKYFHWNVYGFSPLSFEFALTLLGCLPSPSLMAQPERKVLKHHHPWHDTDTQNLWGMVLRAGHCKDLNTAFDTFCSSKTGNYGTCHFLVCLEFSVNPSPTDPFPILSFSACPLAGGVQLLREHWITGSTLCRLWVPDAEAHLTLCTCLTQQAILTK